MENKKPKSLQNFNHKLFAPADLQTIQKLAFHRVFEPFEISMALTLVKKTKVKIEEQITPVFKKTAFIRKGLLASKDKIQLAFHKTKNQLLHRTTYAKQDRGKTFDHLKKNYYQAEVKVRDIFFIQFDKVLSLVFERKFETLIIARAKKVLGINLKNIVDIQRLNRNQRAILLNNMYPFDLNSIGKIKKNINQVSNILLGLVVASNIPLTGMTVNMITTIKTIVYLSNRLHLLSSIYGYPIICKEAVFVVSTKIISSIIDYENNKEHQPLNPAVIRELYIYTMNSDLLTLLKKSTIKDLYISVPFVGSLSLAKITLDEQSITKLTLQLVCDYFDFCELATKYTLTKLEQELKIWSTIYSVQKKQGQLAKELKKITETDDKDPQNFINKMWKKFKNFEMKEQLVLEKIHNKAQKMYYWWVANPMKDLAEYPNSDSDEK